MKLEYLDFRIVYQMHNYYIVFLFDYFQSAIHNDTLRSMSRLQLEGNNED